MSEFDLIVIGGGPKGLVHAFRAAKAGARVKLIEARAQLGGRLGAGGEWADLPLPAFRSVATTVELTTLRALGLDPEDLGWAPAARMTALGAGGATLTLDASPELSRRAMNERASFEADRWHAFTGNLARMGEALAHGQDRAAAHTVGSGKGKPQAKPRALAGLVAAFDQSRSGLEDLMTLLARPLEDALDAALTDPLVRAALAGPSLFQTALSPGDAGSLMAMLGAPLMDPTAPRLDMGYVREDFIDATQNILSVLQAAGVEVELGTAVAEIKLERGKILGVALADGRDVLAPLVASSLDAKATALGLIDWDKLPAQLVRDIGAARSPGVQGRMTIRLNDGAAVPPAFTGGPVYLNSEPHLAAQAADLWHLGRVPDAPPMELIVTSVGEVKLLSAVLHYLPQNPLGQKWTEHQQALLLDAIKESLTPHWPDFASAVKAWRFDGPSDFEATLGWSHGNPFGTVTDVAELLEGAAPLAQRLCMAVDGLSFGGGAEHRHAPATRAGGVRL